MAALSNAEVAAIYRSYGHLLLCRSRIILRDDALAEDALQETLIKVMRYGDNFHAAHSRLRWLYRVVDRCCFDLLSRRKEGPAGHPPPDPVGPHPSIRLEERDAVMRLLHRLSAEERAIAVLAWVDGLSQQQIADEVRLSRVTINKKLQKIRGRAAKGLER
jgi:RNA polymerase sigma-70 factor (ECF subfamily)